MPTGGECRQERQAAPRRSSADRPGRVHPDPADAGQHEVAHRPLRDVVRARQRADHDRADATEEPDGGRDAVEHRLAADRRVPSRPQAVHDHEDDGDHDDGRERHPGRPRGSSLSGRRWCGRARAFTTVPPRPAASGSSPRVISRKRSSSDSRRCITSATPMPDSTSARVSAIEQGSSTRSSETSSVRGSGAWTAGHEPERAEDGAGALGLVDPHAHGRGAAGHEPRDRPVRRRATPPCTIAMSSAIFSTSSRRCDEMNTVLPSSSTNERIIWRNSAIPAGSSPFDGS